MPVTLFLAQLKGSLRRRSGLLRPSLIGEQAGEVVESGHSWPGVTQPPGVLQGTPGSNP